MGIHIQKSGALKRMKKESPYWVMLLPCLLLFFGFVVLPVIQGIPISFTDWDGFSPARNSVGWKNYSRVFSDKYVLNAVNNTFRFTLYEVIVCNVLGLLLALLFNGVSRTNNLCRTLVFMPHVISLVLSAYMIRYMLTELYQYTGILNLLGNKTYVVFGLSIIAIWRDTGYCMIIYLAALQSVDPTMYEVALIEGAGPVKRFFKVTLPLIMPSVTANVTLLTAWGLKLYDYSVAATKGGPGRASESVSMYVYDMIFPYYKAGYGQAIAIVWIVVIFLITQTISVVLRKQEVDV